MGHLTHNRGNEDYSLKDVPRSYLSRWQRFANLMAEAAEVPAALVMRVLPEQIEVLIASAGDKNPYEESELADLGTGLYCETVMGSRDMLAVPDSLADPEWADNPDVKLGMISYLGLPLIWPDDSMFGTVCVLDSAAHVHTPHTQSLLHELKTLIENDFRMIQGAHEQARGAPVGAEIVALPDGDEAGRLFELHAAGSRR